MDTEAIILATHKATPSYCLKPLKEKVEGTAHTKTHIELANDNMLPTQNVSCFYAEISVRLFSGGIS